MEELRDKALAAIEEAAIAAADHGETVPRTLALRFALAFLANFAESRSPFDALWKAVTIPPVDATTASIFGRQQSITRAMNGIYLGIGVERRWEERPWPE